MLVDTPVQGPAPVLDGRQAGPHDRGGGLVLDAGHEHCRYQSGGLQPANQLSAVVLAAGRVPDESGDEAGQ
ncbi:hypothetical protein GCM10023192_83290 [Amycolatopsis samaneae]